MHFFVMHTQNEHVIFPAPSKIIGDKMIFCGNVRHRLINSKYISFHCTKGCWKASADRNIKIYTASWLIITVFKQQSLLWHRIYFGESTERLEIGRIIDKPTSSKPIRNINISNYTNGCAAGSTNNHCSTQ